MRSSDRLRLSRPFETEADRRQTQTIIKEDAFKNMLRGRPSHIIIWDRTLDPHTYMGDIVLHAVRKMLDTPDATLRIFTLPETLQAYIDHPRHTLINFVRAHESANVSIRMAPSTIIPNHDLILAYGVCGAQVFALKGSDKFGARGILTDCPNSTENVKGILGNIARQAQMFAASSGPVPGMPS